MEMVIVAGEEEQFPGTLAVIGGEGSSKQTIENGDSLILTDASGKAWALPVSFLQQFDEPVTIDAGPITTPGEAMLAVSGEWDGGNSILSAITLDIADEPGDASSNPASTYFAVRRNDVTDFQIVKGGVVAIGDPAHSFGGIRRAGNNGEMALWSQISNTSGNFGDMFRFYWQGTGTDGRTDSSVAVLKGFGDNRTSFESVAAMVHISQINRFEYEGFAAGRLGFVGFQAASASGKTIDFNNIGQTPTHASPVVSISIEDGRPEDDILHLGTSDGHETYTTLARFDGSGNLHLPGPPSDSDMAATKGYVDAAVTGLWDLKGDIDCSTDPDFPAALKADAYVVSVAGKIGGGSGASVDIGDVILAKADNPGGTFASVGTMWTILEHDLAGVLLAANNLSDLSNAATARDNLGLGTIATQTASAVSITGGDIGGLTSLVLGASASVQFGGTTSASPALVAAGATLGARLADDSAYTNFGAKCLSALPGANAEGFLSSTQSVTGANTTALVNLATTWSTTGLVTAILLNATDIASDPDSLLMDLRVGGVSKFRVEKTGVVTSSSNITTTASLMVGFNSRIAWNTRSRMLSPANGNITLTNSAQADFGLLQFGGSTGSFPALKRNATALEARLANDSGFASIQGKLTTDTDASAGTFEPTHFLTIYDASGTAYDVPARLH